MQQLQNTARQPTGSPISALCFLHQNNGLTIPLPNKCFQEPKQIHSTLQFIVIEAYLNHTPNQGLSSRVLTPKVLKPSRASCVVQAYLKRSILCFTTILLICILRVCLGTYGKKWKRMKNTSFSFSLVWFLVLGRKKQVFILISKFSFQ